MLALGWGEFPVRNRSDPRFIVFFFQQKVLVKDPLHFFLFTIEVIDYGYGSLSCKLFTTPTHTPLQNRIQYLG